MLRTGKDYIDSLRGGREIWIDGERVEEVSTHPAFALARDLLNSDYAGHRLTFQLFALSPPFSHLLAVYNNYDFSGPLDLVARYSDVADAVRK